MRCPFQLYLSSDHRTLQKSTKRSLLQEAYLTDEASYLSCWQAAFLDPQLRLEYEGAPVPVSSAWGRPGRCSEDVIFSRLYTGASQRARA